MNRSNERILLLILLAVALHAAGCRGCGEPVGEPAGEEQALVEPGVSHVSASVIDLPRATSDWPAIRERGQLRVLVASAEEAFLPRAGTPASHDRILIRELAGRHDLDVRFILVPEHDQLIPMLLDGVGDLIAAQMTVTESREEQVAFTWPLHSVEEIVVHRRGTENPPRTTTDLAGREVHVRPGSSYAETLEVLAEDEAAGVVIVPADEDIDTEAIVYQVSIGARPLTVADSHLLAAIEAYNPDIERLFTIREGRNIAWAVRPKNPELKAVVDAFLIEKAMTAHTTALFTGDLEEIRERGSLRVLTRNNPVTYFLHRGSPTGFDYTLANMAAEALGVQLEMVVPPSRDQLVPWLLEGRGDVIAASFTVTPDREELLAFTRPYLFVDEVLVGHEDGPEIASIEDLDGIEVHVRRSSSYFETLSALREPAPGLRIIEAPEELETEQLIAMVSDGDIPFTVADTHILQVELAYRANVRPLLVLTGEPGAEPTPSSETGVTGSKEIAFAVRPDNPTLHEFLDGFVNRTYRGMEYNMARQRYFLRERRAAGASPSARDGALSPFDELIHQFSRTYGIDWRLMAALAYQESRFNPRAESWVGAQGLFQVMPATGQMLGFHNLMDPTQSTHAGVMYFHRRLSRLDSRIPFEERVRFALAGYNCGIGHVADARRLAAEKGWDQDVWFDNVEKAMLLLMQPRYHRRARHGYVRGTEPVRYVSSIQNRYDNYVQIVPDEPATVAREASSP